MVHEGRVRNIPLFFSSILGLRSPLTGGRGDFEHTVSVHILQIEPPSVLKPQLAVPHEIIPPACKSTDLLWQSSYFFVSLHARLR